MLKYYIVDDNSQLELEIYVKDNELYIVMGDRECDHSLALNPAEAVALRNILTTFCAELDPEDNGP